MISGAITLSNEVGGSAGARGGVGKGKIVVKLLQECSSPLVKLDFESAGEAESEEYTTGEASSERGFESRFGSR